MASGQNAAVEPANLISNRNPPRPIPAAIDNPKPSDRTVEPRCEAISHMLTRAVTKPAIRHACGIPSLRKLNIKGTNAAMTDESGALSPILPTAKAR